MSRLSRTFSDLNAQGRKALVPFLMSGYPFANITPALMLAMADAGADVIELGMPFSDPMADGPLIQKAAERAIANGVGLKQVLRHVQDFRQKNAHTPIVLMGYANPIERWDQLHGAGAFVTAAAQAGVDGVIVVDYPPEECTEFVRQLRAQDMDPIFLLAPTSTPERMREVAAVASGYVYYVSLKGVTGAAGLDVEHVAHMLERVREHVRGLPIGVGFGIRDAASAHAVAQVADAVIIGSQIVQMFEGQPHEKIIPLAVDFIRTMRRAIDAPPGSALLKPATTPVRPAHTSATAQHETATTAASSLGSGATGLSH